ncbi:MAG TPA: formate dehydrogenase accessory protein FdhE [Ardenticatenaceae bacterium]|nr:formate dehydrogenase accessory protein FdhE [Ardenticatenaceae bacterium]
MSRPAIEQLEALARSDPSVAVLARLQLAALHAAGSDEWDEAVPEVGPWDAREGVPVLHETTFVIDAQRAGRLLMELAGTAASDAPEQAERVRGALAGARGNGSDRTALDPLRLLQASIALDTEALEGIAGAADVDPAFLTALGQIAALPLLQACGREARTLLTQGAWSEGSCPVCAGWPALAELRGLERQRWLRCGRCGSAWRYALQRCVFCANSDHRTLGYLAPEGDPESRQALTCDLCHAYLKTVATLAALDPLEVAVRDLTTIELDVAALENGYARPPRPGFPLRVQVIPAPRRNGWLRWRR